MTKQRFILTVREILPDRKSNAIERFPTSELLKVATFARAKALEFLVTKALTVDFSAVPTAASGCRLTLTNMVKDGVTGTDGTNVPPDFFRLICGRESDGKYVPAAAIYPAESFGAHSEPLIWVRDGKFRGSAATAVYYAKPSEDFADTDDQFTEFSDAFYNTVAFRTAMELMHGERRNTARFKILGDLFQQHLLCLQ